MAHRCFHAIRFAIAILIAGAVAPAADPVLPDHAPGVSAPGAH